MFDIAHFKAASKTKAYKGAIDTHAHVYPAKYLDFLERIGVSASRTKVARDIQASDEEKDMLARLKMMDDAGIQKQVLSVTPQLPLVDCEQNAAEAVRMANHIYANLIAKFPARFIAYGATPLPHTELAIKEVAYCLDELKFHGMTITTVLQNGLSIADERFAPFYAELNRRHAILYIHPTGSGACSSMINQADLAWVNGAPVEDATAVLQLLKAEIPHRYPNIRFHIAHLGGDLAFLSQRLEDNFEDWHSFKHSPRESLRRMWFDSANFYAPSLRLALKTYDPKRVMLGSDYPYFRYKKYTRAVGYIKEAKLPANIEADILYRNAYTFYGLHAD
jgi:amidohydrolase 2